MPAIITVIMMTTSLLETARSNGLLCSHISTTFISTARSSSKLAGQEIEKRSSKEPAGDAGTCETCPIDFVFPGEKIEAQRILSAIGRVEYWLRAELHQCVYCGINRDFDTRPSQECVVNQASFHGAQHTGLMTIIQAGRDDLDLE